VRTSLTYTTSRLSPKQGDGKRDSLERSFHAHVETHQFALITVAREYHKAVDKRRNMSDPVEYNDKRGLPTPWTRTSKKFKREEKEESRHNGTGGNTHVHADSQGNPDANEDAAREVASRQGQVQELCYPLHRVLKLYLDDNKCIRNNALDYYQQESPFYFRGAIDERGWSDQTNVFCKVWREGDRRKNQQHIKDEIPSTVTQTPLLSHAL
jgi:hypothetical protein